MSSSSGSSSSSSSTMHQASAPLDGLDQPHALCEAAVEYALAYVNTIQYLIKSIEEITSKPFARERIKCLPATPQLYANRNSAVKKSSLVLNPDQVFAGYMWRRARPDCEAGDIALIEEHVPLASDKTSETEHSAATNNNNHTNADHNNVVSDAAASAAAQRRREYLETHHSRALAHVERNIRHELIHAFDEVRGFVVSADCSHQACSEVRAARLSGDCYTGEEVKKGRFNLLQGGMQCVRRRAITAVETNPVCRGFSERAVETVFQKCYSDYEPFAAPVYAMGSYGEDTFENATWKL